MSGFAAKALRIMSFLLSCAKPMAGLPLSPT
jgi:hypothetical protein